MIHFLIGCEHVSHAHTMPYATPSYAKELCYTGTMQVRQKDWQTWAQILQRWNLSEPVAALLDGAGPLTVLLAQFLHFGQPLLGRLLPAGQWDALAKLLEEQEESRSFAAFLRENDR